MDRLGNPIPSGYVPLDVSLDTADALRRKGFNVIRSGGRVYTDPDSRQRYQEEDHFRGDVRRASRGSGYKSTQIRALIRGLYDELATNFDTTEELATEIARRLEADNGISLDPYVVAGALKIFEK
ncbi:MAG: hypothetical protein HY361_04020 [Candidatus Aenigmarchaeota archaeon]|nr:hypothetical protein [Candidatus Aenigmarchaeota archaeon]